FFFQCYADPPVLPSFPTRRSSDLDVVAALGGVDRRLDGAGAVMGGDAGGHPFPGFDRDGEGSLVAGRVLARHQRQPEPLDPIARSEEHTSELQSLAYLVCRLLLEK